MNLFTGNKEPTGNASHSTTKANTLYGDLLLDHEVSEEGVGYPVWLDTVGLDESDADVTNGDLVRSYLRVLQCFKIEWVHAVVWCITPEDKVHIFQSHHLKQYFSEAAIPEGSGRSDQNVWREVTKYLEKCCYYCKGRKSSQSQFKLPG